MTLRRLLHSLVADSSARAEFVSDPDSVLADAGLAGLGDELIGTALIHQADATSIDELEALAPLLDRFVPIPGVVRVVDAAIPEDDVDAERLLDDLVADTADDAISDDIDDHITITTDDPSTTDGHLDGLTGDGRLQGGVGTQLDAGFGTGAVPITVSTPLSPTDPGATIEPSPGFDRPDFGVDRADQPAIRLGENADVLEESRTDHHDHHDDDFDVSD